MNILTVFSKVLFSCFFVFSLSCLPILLHGQGCVAVRYMQGCTAEGMLRANQWQVAVGYRYLHSYKHFKGNEEQKERVELGTEVINNTFSYDVSLSYSISKKIGLLVGIPYSQSNRSSLYEHDQQNRYTTKSRGLGDIRLSATYWVGDSMHHADRDLQIGLGVKLPTGDFYAKDVFYTPTGPKYTSVDQSIQPGDGGFGIILEGQAYSRFCKNFMAYMNGFYLFNPRNMNGTPANGGFSNPRRDSLQVGAISSVMSVADQYMLRAGVSWNLAPKQHLSLSLGGRAEGVPVWDVIGPSEGFRRPGYVVSIEPGVIFSPGRHSVTFNLPVALFRNRTKNVSDIRTNGPGGDAAFADYLILLNYAYRF